MQKVIIDTNVIIASIISKGIPFLIMQELFLEEKIQLCISDDLIEEYFTVINRPKFNKYHEFLVRAESFLSEIEMRALHFNPTVKINIISDLKDNMMLELAEVSNADYIITGNSNDFTFDSFKNTKIVSPKEYWDFYKSNI